MSQWHNGQRKLLLLLLITPAAVYSRRLLSNVKLTLPSDKWAEYGFQSRLDEYCKFWPRDSKPADSAMSIVWIRLVKRYLLHGFLTDLARCVPQLPRLALSCLDLPQR